MAECDLSRYTEASFEQLAHVLALTAQIKQQEPRREGRDRLQRTEELFIAVIEGLINRVQQLEGELEMSRWQSRALAASQSSDENHAQLEAHGQNSDELEEESLLEEPLHVKNVGLTRSEIRLEDLPPQDHRKLSSLTCRYVEEHPQPQPSKHSKPTEEKQHLLNEITQLRALLSTYRGRLRSTRTELRELSWCLRTALGSG